jgi:hypothetical protein
MTAHQVSRAIVNPGYYSCQFPARIQVGLSIQLNRNLCQRMQLKVIVECKVDDFTPRDTTGSIYTARHWLV